MPADILATDTLFPELNGKETVDQKFEMVTDYLWLLREQLTFALTNLGVANFNASQLAKLGNTLTEPFAVMIAEQDKKFADFQVTIDGINSTISELDETFMKQTDFSVTANGVSVTIGETTSELASVSKLTSTANSLNSTITSVRSTANTAKSTADSAKSTADTVSNNYISKSSATQTSSGFDLEVMNSSGSFARASLTASGLTLRNNSGTTVLSADTSGNLTVTGTITGSTIKGSEIYGTTLYTCLPTEVNYLSHLRLSGDSLYSYQGNTLNGLSLATGIDSTGFHALGGYYDGYLCGYITCDSRGLLVNALSALNNNGVWLGGSLRLQAVSAGGYGGAYIDLSAFADASPAIFVSSPSIYLDGSVYINGVYFQPS